MKRYSKNYVMTVAVESVNDCMALDMIKKAVKIANEGSTNKKRVVLRGRRPIEKTGTKSYDWAGNIVGGIYNASEIDVYIYDRR